jgi:uncharacterized membrane protein
MTTPTLAPGAPITGERIVSIDIIRGAIMVLMALDHVRVYSGLPAGGPAPGIFFTRWVTHFCAPGFVFLAGTSAFLYGRRHTDLARFLVTRGAWLILLELTVLRLGWTFNLDIAHQMAGVIWAIGWCMILLALLSRLPVTAVGTIGLVIIAGQNLLDPVLPTLAGSAPGWLWTILVVGPLAGPIALSPDGPWLVVLYSIIPWVGVMAAGYAFGTIVVSNAARRRAWCLRIGLGAIALFLVLRGFNLYGDPSPWGAIPTDGRPHMPALLSFLNTTKYPASLDFLLMTLGPIIALVPLLESARVWLARTLTLFGRVPFFFYLLHIPLIHALALVVSKGRSGKVSPWLFTNHPMGNPPAPEGYAWSLALLYLVWAASLVLLYFACRWYADFKLRRTDWWLRYL